MLKDESLSFNLSNLRLQHRNPINAVLKYFSNQVKTKHLVADFKASLMQYNGFCWNVKIAYGEKVIGP